MRNPIKNGVWPTMITPYCVDGSIDHGAVREIAAWYVGKECQGIFAVCQSSEMFQLTLKERTALAKTVMNAAQGKVDVIVSGHTSGSLFGQLEELKAMADTGAKAVVLVTNRLAECGENDDVWIRNAERVLNALPGIRLGLYECPYPYKRLLSKKVIQWCANARQFDFLKDTCCNADMIRERLIWIRAAGNEEFKLFNANSATLLQSLRDGAAGFSGVMANFHPDLYAWLVKEHARQPKKAERLQAFLTLASQVESMYPVCAKYHMNLEGITMHLKSRSTDEALFDITRQTVIDHLFIMEIAIREMAGMQTL